jgi:hypothetical protein
VFVASPGAEHLLVRERSVAEPEESPVFAVERLQRLPEVVRSLRDPERAIQQLCSRRSNRHEVPTGCSARQRLASRRLTDLERELERLEALGIDVSRFWRVALQRVEASLGPVAGGPALLEVVVP